MIHVQCGRSKLYGSKWRVKSVVSKVVRLKIEVAQKKTVILAILTFFFSGPYLETVLFESLQTSRYMTAHLQSFGYSPMDRPTLTLAHYFALIYMVE